MAWAAGSEVEPVEESGLNDAAVVVDLGIDSDASGSVRTPVRGLFERQMQDLRWSCDPPPTTG